jgi:pimeloyl-ACP methyl ester carboxylesterase
MPEANVRGIHINYEVIGDTGPVIALTPGSRRPYDELVDLSKAIASKGYRVLLHDRRNCGKSDVFFDGSASEHAVWADDLHALAKHVGVENLYVGGSSSGARLAILFAIRHPQALSGLLLWRVTGGQHAVNQLSENYYGQYIKLASTAGMEAVANSEHFAKCISARPSNRERLMKMDVDAFIKVMTSWREAFLQSSSLPIVGATEAQLNAIHSPACLIVGNDIVHTPVTAHKAAGLLPNSELHEDVVKKFPEEKLRHHWDPKEWRDAEPQIAEIFTTFLKKAESGH